MPLRFNGEWRFNPPADGEYYLTTIPNEVIKGFIAALAKCVTQGHEKSLYEHFKRHFCKATDSYYGTSSATGWSKHDLEREMETCKKNAPLFIEAIYNGVEEWKHVHPDYYLPPIGKINQLLGDAGVGYVIEDDELILSTEVELIEPMQPNEDLGQKAINIYRESMSRSEQLLRDGHGREAVQELLWLLETISTAFRGAKTETGSVEGAYFNKIVAELKEVKKDTTFSQILKWINTMHGYLSSPAGGGVRHGLDLNRGVELKGHETELFCNLIRSYMTFLLHEYDAIAARTE